MLPVILFLLAQYRNPTLLSFANVMTNAGFTMENNAIFNAFMDIFGVGGIFPCFSENVGVIVSWFVMMVVVHAFVDIMLFIPRLCHNWIDKYSKKTE